MRSYAVGKPGYLGSSVFVFFEVDKVLGAHLCAKILLLCTCIDNNGPHSHGPRQIVSKAVKVEDRASEDSLGQLDTLNTYTASTTREDNPGTGLQFRVHQSAVHG